ncbi:hypothetical protein KIN20_006864 [Parelaphostrongylus tenuis]|uniref:Uncharacterized protein n=1 Tax=Parelaphostrongylus tenuis TaxID=148309 RepID=A0AAD5QGD6_PARTN|nr:hypothetical protein KIN20_006864 [Parelaphostrongylus tenuis]
MILVIAITAVMGCGVIPPGQASTRRFTVTGFTLPVSMAYAKEPEIPVKVPGIAVSMEAANAFVSRLVMQTDAFVKAAFYYMSSTDEQAKNIGLMLTGLSDYRSVVLLSVHSVEDK